MQGRPSCVARRDVPGAPRRHVGLPHERGRELQLAVAEFLAPEVRGGGAGGLKVGEDDEGLPCEAAVARAHEDDAGVRELKVVSGGGRGRGIS